MTSQPGYEARLAALAAEAAHGRPEPQIAMSWAAGLLAARLRCRVVEAHSHLVQLAEELGRPAADLALDLVAALEIAEPASPAQVRQELVQTLRLPEAEPSLPPAGIDVGSGDWVGIVGELLAVLPEDHAFLLPVRDDAGELTDFVLAAASPAARDVSGRHGRELVGLRLKQAYPRTVSDSSPLWQAYAATLVDGVSREVGPFPYGGVVEHAPAELEISVRLHRVGPGLLVSWVHHDDGLRLAQRLEQTERLGNLGWGEWDLLTDSVEWSDGLYRIYERDPAAGPLSREESEAMVLPEDLPIRQQAAESIARGEPVDMTLRIRVAGKLKHIRTVADAVRDRQGRPLRLYGLVQDITARENSRLLLAEVRQQLVEQQRSLAAEHQVAIQLQQIVLPIPAVPVDLPGLRVAVRYLPAEQVTRVGGDWFHAAAALDGTVVIAVGDVAGHGIPAAATMAQLRHALAALTVTTTTDPAGLLTYLNQLLHASGSATSLATAIVARFDPASTTLIWAQAGHPAPLRTRAGETTQLERPPGPILGALANAEYGTASIQVEPGDLLLLYTDGLIEHRGRSLSEGLKPVVATLNRISAAASPQPLADLLAQLPRANPDDDTCLLAIRSLARWRTAAGAGEEGV